MTKAMVLAVPGASAVMVATKGASDGWRRTYAVIAGQAAAIALYFALSATGIAGLILASHMVFLAIKWVGAAYLVYLGISILMARSGGLSVSAGAGKSPLHKLFTTGFIVEFANPKAVMFFAAILPQFLDLTRPLVAQIVIMYGVTLCLQIIIYGVYAGFGARIASGGVRASVVAWLNRGAGAALVFAGLRMATTSVR